MSSGAPQLRTYADIAPAPFYADPLVLVPVVIALGVVALVFILRRRNKLSRERHGPTLCRSAGGRCLDGNGLVFGGSGISVEKSLRAS